MAVIALMEREFVQKRRLLSGEEFLHGVGLGQILGSFAANAAFFIGYRLFGVAGGMLSTGVFMMPSLALVIALSDFYFRYHSIPALQAAVVGLGPVVIALILDAAWSLGRQVLRTPVALCIAGAALAAGALKTNAVWVLLGAGMAGLLIAKPAGRRGRWSSSRQARGAGDSGDCRATVLTGFDRDDLPENGHGLFRRRLRAGAGTA